MQIIVGRHGVQSIFDTAQSGTTQPIVALLRDDLVLALLPAGAPLRLSEQWLS
jgi:hypothetical protein